MECIAGIAPVEAFRARSARVRRMAPRRRRNQFKMLSEQKGLGISEEMLQNFIELPLVSGFGSNTWPDGTVYHGAWRANCPSGPGEYVLSGGWEEIESCLCR